jgi:hypothetical protein
MKREKHGLTMRMNGDQEGRAGKLVAGTQAWLCPPFLARYARVLRLSKKSEIISNHKFLIHLNPCVSQSPSHAVDGGQIVRKKAKEEAKNTGQSPSFLLI